MRDVLRTALLVSLGVACALLASCSLVGTAQTLADPDDPYANVELSTWDGDVINPDAAVTPVQSTWQDASGDANERPAAQPVPFEPSPELLAFAAEEASQANHRFEVFLEYEIETVGVLGSRTRPVAKGIATEAGAVTNMDIGVLASGPIKRRVPIATIHIDDVMYMQSSLFGPLALSDARLTRLASLDGGWGYAVLDPALGDGDAAAAAGAGPADRQQMLDAVRAVEEISEVGAGEVRGVPTTTARSSALDAETLSDLLGTTMTRSEATAAGLRGEISIDVDAQSRVRRVELTMWVDDASVIENDFEPGTALRSWIRFDLFDFGTTYQISEPEQATDITDEIRLLRELGDN